MIEHFIKLYSTLFFCLSQIFAFTQDNCEVIAVYLVDTLEFSELNQTGTIYNEGTISVDSEVSQNASVRLVSTNSIVINTGFNVLNNAALEVFIEEKSNIPTLQYEICRGEELNVKTSLEGYEMRWFDEEGQLVMSGDLDVVPDSTTFFLCIGQDTTTCTISDPLKVSVEVKPVPSLPSGDNSYNVCQGDSVMINNSSEEVSEIYWFDNKYGAGPPLIISDSIKVEGSATRSIFSFAYSDGCFSPYSEVDINVLTNPQAIISSVDTVGDYVPNGRSFNTTSLGNITSHQWMAAGTSVQYSNAIQPTFEYGSPGDYNLSYSVIDENGCSNQFDTVISLVPFVDSSDIYIRGGVSANNDGVNDTWHIPYWGLTDPSIQIFNRMGVKVFEHDLDDGLWDPIQYWDGNANTGTTLGSGLIPEGTYYFVFRSSEVNLVGFIELVR